MKTRIIAAAIALAFVTLACSISVVGPSIGPATTNTPVPIPQEPTNQPTLPPTDSPAAPAETPKILDILTLNGFTEAGKDVCKEFNPCVEYWHQSPKMLVTVYGDGVVAYTFGVEENMDTDAIAHLLAGVLGRMYPGDMNKWIAGNMAKALKGPQETQLDGYDIYIQFSPAKSGGSATITILVSPVGLQSPVPGGFTS